MTIEDRLRDAMGSITAEEPPQDLVDRALAALPPRRSPRRLPFMVASLAAAGVLIFAIAVLAVSSLGLGPDRVDGPGVAIAPTEGPSSVTDTPTPQVSPTAEATPTLTTAPATAPPTDPATPRADLTDQERSDLYWNAITRFGNFGFRYDSLAEITRDAHLIVRGRVTDLKQGEIQPFEEGPLGASRVTFGIVTIHEVLKGVPEMRVEGTIEVARLGFSGMSAADLPAHEVILFLKNYAQMRVDEGAAPSEDAYDRYYYVRPNGYQSVLRNIDGRVDVIIGWPAGWEDNGEFPISLDGKPFEDMAEQIRQVVLEAP